jgi:hypothetical protein
VTNDTPVISKVSRTRAHNLLARRVIEAVRGDKNKETYKYEVQIRRRDKIDESRRCIMSGLSGGRKREEGRREKR